jgi:phosphoglycerol transferase
VPDTERRRKAVERIALYGGTAVLSLLAAIWVLDLPGTSLRVPFRYGGDGLLPALEVKAIADNGWCLTIPQLGAPAGLRMHDFPPQFDSLHLLAVKLMSAFVHDWALTFNLYFLLGFPLIAVSALAVFRHFGVSRSAAIAASILYAFLPSRLIKGEAHLFLDTFFQVPLAIMLVLWVSGGAPPLVRDRSAQNLAPGLEFRSRRSIAALLIALIVGTTGLYYAFFAGCLLLVAGAWAAIVRRSPSNLLAGLMLTGAVALTVGAEALPTVAYRSQHGVNTEVANRLPGESEVYGLRISQLLLPIEGHRVPYLRRLEDRYRASAPMPGEFLSTSLGFVASIGFLILLGRALLGGGSDGRRDGADLLRPLASLNLTAILLGTVGGFGSLFALLVSPQIRTYCRLNVFIVFIALFAVALLLDRLRRVRPPLTIVGAGLALILGLFDQTTPVHWNPVTASRYSSDGELVDRIEKQLPAGAMIFQLPFGTFPESIGDYELVRPYLHSRSLRWSYPAMRGREDETWARNVATLAPADLLSALRRSGFAGILIDRDLYRDRGAAVEMGVAAILGGPAQASRDGNLAFFKLS